MLYSKDIPSLLGVELLPSVNVAIWQGLHNTDNRKPQIAQVIVHYIIFIIGPEPAVFMFNIQYGRHEAL